MVKKKYYNAASLERSCLSFERHYGMSSEEFYASYTSGEAGLEDIPRFHRHLWASFYRGSCAPGGEFVSQVERTLALA